MHSLLARAEHDALVFIHLWSLCSNGWCLKKHRFFPHTPLDLHAEMLWAHKHLWQSLFFRTINPSFWVRACSESLTISYGSTFTVTYTTSTLFSVIVWNLMASVGKKGIVGVCDYKPTLNTSAITRLIIRFWCSSKNSNFVGSLSKLVQPGGEVRWYGRWQLQY